MKDLSLHLLDLVQNCITAGASLVSIGLTLDAAGMLTMAVQDDGCGMDEDMALRAQSPFTTSRSTRKVGLGIPLTKANAELTGGSLRVESHTGEGTTITAVFNTRSIDCLPLGDIAGTVTSLVAAHPVSPDFLVSGQSPLGACRFDTREIREALQGIRLNEPEIILWIQQSLTEDIQALFGGSLH